MAATSARADMVGAVAGAGTGLLVAGPPGAVVGGVVGAVWGKPFWGPVDRQGSLLDRQRLPPPLRQALELMFIQGRGVLARWPGMRKSYSSLYP